MDSFGWLNGPSNVSNELHEIVDSTEALLALVEWMSVLPLKFNPDWLNGLAFIDVSLVLIDEFGIVSNELEELLNAP